ncbi:Mitochondrial E3 ubiquitin protein ligase 1 [Pseudolycoriella hygida]|uniref:RING-type E3 ubiquitin transferase n=1 Tax=Pseudolycoriella hygida TaxID=35572 RepID=A0A9Q0N6D2_9DIPT|nr:Mitochondrial E3 ubiquitin protein ligase 1 [Pseudolycoriella hygida]
MDYLHELLALGVDGIILGLCLKEYLSYKKTLDVLKVAKQYPIDENLINTVKQSKDGKIGYGIIRGTVKPIGQPIQSIMSPSVTGVLQVVKLSEHRITRGFAGFWTEQRKLIHVSSNEVPFTISNGNVGVEIVDGLGAELLDLDVVYDNYEPSTLSFFDHIFGFFSGMRQRGLQTTEEVLRDGSFITAVGEIDLDGNSLRLQSSKTGPMLLTTATKNTLVKKLQEAKSSMMFKVIMCSTISAVLIGVIARKFYLKKKEERHQRSIQEALEHSRRARRARSRPTGISERDMCVVCVSNPKEVICLPCGHVCLCEDCALQIKDFCPICRAKIESKTAAFV